MTARRVSLCVVFLTRLSSVLSITSQPHWIESLKQCSTSPDGVQEISTYLGTTTHGEYELSQDDENRYLRIPAPQLRVCVTRSGGDPPQPRPRKYGTARKNVQVLLQSERKQP